MTSTGQSADPLTIGPLYHDFQLTLVPGHRREALGPLFSYELKESARLWAVSPLFSHVADQDAEIAETDFLYPLVSYDRFGPEYRFQLLQLLSFSGGRTYSETNVHRLTLFPIYFQQRSAIPDKNYTALVPIYGRLKGRLFRDELKFVLMPLYVQSRKRDVVTDNFLYPIIHVRHGEGLNGWQAWPLVGREHKEVTSRTNLWGETETVGGHEKLFALWPLFFNQTMGIGTDNPEKHRAVIPLFSATRSPQRDSTTAPWPIGFTYTEDRAKKYTEWGAPWPLVVFGRGEGKTTSRFWPLFSQSHNDTLESDWYLWPIFKYNRIHSDPLDRERTRILFFLFSDLKEKNTETGAALYRTDFWPLFTARRDFNGNQRVQILSLIEPILPNNKSIERSYSPLWSLWRSEKNARTGATSQSFLWNLYRRDTTAGTKKCSLLFGLFKYQSRLDGTQLRLFYIPVVKTKKPATDEPAVR